jgi:hypothetical protein
MNSTDPKVVLTNSSHSVHRKPNAGKTSIGIAIQRGFTGKFPDMLLTNECRTHEHSLSSGTLEIISVPRWKI